MGLVAAAAQAGADGVAASNYDPSLQPRDAKIAGKIAKGATGSRIAHFRLTVPTRSPASA